MSEQYLQLGAVTVIFIYFLGKLSDLIKNWINKKNGITNSNEEKTLFTLEKLRLAERLTAVEIELKNLKERFDNHIHTLYQKIDDIRKEIIETVKRK